MLCCQNYRYYYLIEGMHMKATESISIWHVVLIAMTFIGLKNHVTIIPSILKNVGRDGWASVLIGAIAVFIWLFLLIYIHNKSKKEPISDWLKKKIGKVGAAIVLYSTAFYLLLLAAFTMRETLLWVTTAFLPKTPMIILLMIYTALIVYLVSSGIQTITIVNVFVLFGVVVLGFFVAFVNIQVKDYHLLRPFFEHGIEPVMIGMIYPASGFVELMLLLFIQHRVKGGYRWYHFAIMLLLLMGLTTGPLIGAITEFGPIEAAKQRYPAYEEWGLATIGRFIEHVDFFSVYQWLTGAFIRIGIILYIVVEILNMTGDKKSIWTKITPPFFFICLSLNLIQDNVFLDINEKQFLIITFFFFLLLSVFLAIVAFFSKGSSTKAKDENDKKSGEDPSAQVESQ